MAVNWKEIDKKFIIDYCKENKEVAWLKAAANEKVDVKVYPKMRVIRYDENGNPVLKKNGKPAMVSKPDTSKPFTTKKAAKSFVQLKYEFCEKFMPAILPSKAVKKPTFIDEINALEE